jgi:hypothetical protein
MYIYEYEYECTYSRFVSLCETGACVKNTGQEISLMPQLAAYNVASVAIDFIRMGCPTVKSSWP